MSHVRFDFQSSLRLRPPPLLPESLPSSDPPRLPYDAAVPSEVLLNSPSWLFISLLSVLQVPVGNFLPASGSGTVFFNEVPGTVQRTIQYNRKHRARILKCFLSAGARAL